MFFFFQSSVPDGLFHPPSSFHHFFSGSSTPHPHPPPRRCLFPNVCSTLHPPFIPLLLICFPLHPTSSSSLKPPYASKVKTSCEKTQNKIKMVKCLCGLCLHPFVPLLLPSSPACCFFFGFTADRPCRLPRVRRVATRTSSGRRRLSRRRHVPSCFHAVFEE